MGLSECKEDNSGVLLCIKYSFKACSTFWHCYGFFSIMSSIYQVGSCTFGIVEAMVVITALWFDRGMGSISDASISSIIPIVKKIWSMREKD